MSHAIGEPSREDAPHDQGNNALWIRTSFLLLFLELAVPVALKIIQKIRTNGLHLRPLGSDPSELSDKAVWGSVLLACAVLALIRMLPRYAGRLNAFPVGPFRCVCLGAGLATAIVWDQSILNLGGQLWFGFGYPVLLLSILAIPFLWQMRIGVHRSLVLLLAFAGDLIVAVVYLPVTIQPPWGLMSSYDAGYVINEIMATIVGNYPMAGSVTQYTSLFGYPLLWLSKVVPADGLLRNPGLTTSIYLTLLTVLTLAILIRVNYQVLPTHLRSLAALFAIPLMLVHQQPADTIQGSITVLFSAIPVRTLPVAVIGAALLSRRLRATPSRRAWVIGILAGLAALNNFEFGVPTLIAALIVCLFSTPDLQAARGTFLKFLGPSVGVFGAYWALLRLDGHHPDFAKWTTFARAFSSGFGSLPMPLVGTHLLVLTLLGSGTILGFSALRATAALDPADAIAAQRYRAATASLFFGLAGLGSFGYYVGRSVTSGQLQIFLIYLAPVIAALFGLIELPTLTSPITPRQLANAALPLLPIGLTVGALLQAPDPSHEWQRVADTASWQTVSHTGGPHRFDSPYDAEVTATRALIATVRVKYPGARLSLALTHGNYLSARLHLKNVSEIDSPLDAQVIKGSVSAAYCAHLDEISGPILTENFYAADKTPICGRFALLMDLGKSYSLIQRE